MISGGATLEQARAAKARAAEVFRPLVGEVSVGITSVGTNQYGLKVNLSAAPAADVCLPREIEGVPVQVEVVGPIRKR